MFVSPQPQTRCEPEVDGGRAPVVSENAGDPALPAQQDVGMPVEISGESASVKCGAGAVADSEERARLRVRAASKRRQKQDMETQAKTKAMLAPRRSDNAQALNLSQIWRKRSRSCER